LTPLVTGANTLAAGAAASIIRVVWREDLTGTGAGGTVLGLADRGWEAAEADEGGALGERVEDGVECIGERGGGTSWETGNDGDKSGESEFEEKLRWSGQWKVKTEVDQKCGLTWNFILKVLSE